MKLLMGGLKQAPCHVFLDGPPVKGSPDARILAELADFVVLVVGYASATPEEIGQGGQAVRRGEVRRRHLQRPRLTGRGLPLPRD